MYKVSSRNAHMAILPKRMVETYFSLTLGLLDRCVCFIGYWVSDSDISLCKIHKSHEKKP